MIILILFCIMFIAGAVYGYISWNTNLVPLNKYTGEFSDVLNKGHSYLLDNFDIRWYDIVVAVRDDNRVCIQGWGWFFKPYFLVNENVFKLDSWTSDMNRIADIVGEPKLADRHAAAVFWLFHEFRHLLQAKGLAKDLRYLDKNDPRVQNSVISYHQRPKESDADIFALYHVNKCLSQ